MNTPTRILAVDDEAYMLKIIGVCFARPNFDLTTCLDAMTGMALFKKNNFDIVMLDVVMPGIDGFELHSLIRSVNKDIPIIMLTAKVDAMNGQMLKKISGDKNTYYQSKNFKKDEFVSKVNSIMAERRTQVEKQNYFDEMEKDIALAGELQHTMFPSWELRLHDVRVTYFYRPYMKITGDLFNVMELGKNRVLAIIGDVSGHGIQAALCMAALEFSLANTLRTIDSEKIAPHLILNNMQIFMGSIITERYMTCIVMLIDFEKNILTFQNAGHPDFLLYSPSQKKIIEHNPENKGNVPVGLIPNCVYKAEDDVRMEIPPDAIILANTDGVTDLQNKIGETYNINPLEEFVASFAKDGLRSETCFQIIDTLFKMGFDAIKDDISLAAISRVPHKEKVYEFLISPRLKQIDSFAQELSKIVEKETGSTELAAKAELLVSEFMNNIVVHGLGGKQASRPVISAFVQFREDELSMTVCDKGKKWDLNLDVASTGTGADILNYTRAGSGRGMAIIKNIVSSICRNRYADLLNETTFTIKY